MVYPCFLLHGLSLNRQNLLLWLAPVIGIAPLTLIAVMRDFSLLWLAHLLQYSLIDCTCWDLLRYPSQKTGTKTRVVEKSKAKIYDHDN